MAEETNDKTDDKKRIPLNKEVSFELKEIDEDEMKDFYIVKGLASTFGGKPDSYDDIMGTGCFDSSIEFLTKKANKQNTVIGKTGKMALLPCLFQHDRHYPIGSFIKLGITKKGLMVTLLLPKDDTNVVGKIMPQLKVKSIGSMSIGGYIIDSEWDRVTNTRTITRFELYEISLVIMPANPNAVITSFKSFKDEQLDAEMFPIAKVSHPFVNAEAVARVLKLDPGMQKTSLAAGEFSDIVNREYCFADVIEGELKIIPRAVFAAAVKVELDDSDISDEQVAVIKENIRISYDKMGRKDPFEMGFSDAELKAASLDELGALFRNGQKLSRSGSEYVVDALIKSNKKPISLESETTHDSLTEAKNISEILKNI